MCIEHLETFVNSGTKSFRVGRKVSETHRNIIMKFAYWIQPTWLTTQQILNYPAFLMVKQWIEQSHMQSLGAWATEIEIIAAASLLQTTIYGYGPCRKMSKWQKHTTHREKTDDNHCNECIYINNIGKHFETVKRM